MKVARFCPQCGSQLESGRGLCEPCKKYNKQGHLRIKVELLPACLSIAQQQGTTISKLVNKVMEDYLKEKGGN